MALFLHFMWFWSHSWYIIQSIMLQCRQMILGWQQLWLYPFKHSMLWVCYYILPGTAIDLIITLVVHCWAGVHYTATCCVSHPHKTQLPDSCTWYQPSMDWHWSCCLFSLATNQASIIHPSNTWCGDLLGMYLYPSYCLLYHHAVHSF